MSGNPVQSELLVEFAALLRRLRGDTTTAEVARRLGMGPMAVCELELRYPVFRRKGCTRPNPTLQRVEKLGAGYGVRFKIVAVDRETGEPVTGVAPALSNPSRRYVRRNPEGK